MIRKATINDLEDLCRIEKLCFKRERYSKEFIFHLLETPDIYSFVFEDKNLIGYIIISFNQNIGRIISIAVHPSHRKKGIGKKLLDRAEEKVKQSNIRSIVLEVSTKNRDALNFYLSNKYKITGLIEDYYGAGKNAYRMSKDFF